MAETLPRMFDSPTSDSANQIESSSAYRIPSCFPKASINTAGRPSISGYCGPTGKCDMIDSYILSKGILYCLHKKRGDPKLVVPTAAISMVFVHFHESQPDEHAEVFKTISTISSQFIWKGMDKDKPSSFRACQTGALSKLAQNCHWGLVGSDVAQRPIQKIFLGYLGELSRNKAGNSAILGCVDAFSKFVWFVPVKEPTTRTTINRLN